MNKTSHKNLINGIASDYLTIDDRSIHYGDGLFETILCDGNKLYFWAQHFQRLQSSAQRLKIPWPAEQLLLDDINRLLDENRVGATSARVIKIIVSRGVGERGYAFSKKVTANRIVSLSELATDYSSLLVKKLLSGKLFLCEQQVSINKNLAGIKHLNRLENVLARNEWQTDYIDGLMLNANQHVIEGTMSNLFAVKNNQLFTPDLALCGVSGIMRDVIMQIAVKNNIEVIVDNLALDALFEKDELFITNSLIGMKSVTCLAEVTYNKSHVSNIIFDALLDAMKDHAQNV
jgi:4-amino-4-deoxychorismate lyase